MPRALGCGRGKLAEKRSIQKMKKAIFSFGVGVVACTLGSLSPKAYGTGFVYQFDNSFSGGVPGGHAPWVGATFQDSSQGVLLTVDNGGLIGTEFLSELYLNINPADNTKISSLKFTLEGETAGVSAPTIQTGVDHFKADGDGLYDVLFSFATANAGRFGAGDSVTYLISGIPGLTAADFQFLSTPDGGHGPFDAAGHIQGIQCMDDSGWIDPSMGPLPIATPEPAATAVLIVATGVFGLRRLWLRRK
jgi:hypothetical protein